MTEVEEEKVDTTTQETGGPQPGPAASTARSVRRPLTRSRSDKMFAGVAGGLGEYFAVDPILFRLIFALLAFLGGAGVALYLAAWLLIPQEGEAASVGEVTMAKASRYVSEGDSSWLWIAALVIGGLVVISNLGSLGYDDAWFWAVLLIAGGVWLYRQDSAGRNGARVDVAPAVYPGSAAAASNPGTTAVTGPAYVATRPEAPRGPTVPKAPPSLLGRYTFAVALVALGVVAMLDNSGALDVSASEYAAIALTTVGAGLLVGSVLGRARGLILLGFLLVPSVLVGDGVDIPLGGGVGERSYHPVLADELSDEYQLFAGDITFDLTQMAWGDEPVEITAGVFMGQIEVLVPEGVDVRFTGHAEVGAVKLFDQTREGNDVDLNTFEGLNGGPELVLDTQVFMGEVSVIRSGIPAKELS